MTILTINTLINNKEWQNDNIVDNIGLSRITTLKLPFTNKAKDIYKASSATCKLDKHIVEQVHFMLGSKVTPEVQIKPRNK